MAIQKEQLIEQLRRVFHTYGYDGTSLSLISQATGLGKGSLYHHFPNGKQEMASAVLQAEGIWFQAGLNLLRQEGEPNMRLAQFIQFIALTEQDKLEASTLDIYTMGNARSLFGADMGLAVQEWIAALNKLMQDAGIAPAVAQHRAISTIAKLEGARMLCRCLDDWQIFEQLLQELPQDLLN
ncbi:TetR/AcrR family transcriptional regulator [Chitinibacter fontanus]|uniref:TetR/AcrR family transcriptional regulator n=1 Tax=Chitinibacter fontanus TaxID=1737446 RepID=UPI001D1332DD|nr:TetR/AcrR family transcriptional regulator [Chitinibacter fontanus]